MSVVKVNDQLYSWASLIEENTLAQAEATASLSIIAGHVALMPDAHLGIGATVGSVIPTNEAIIPSAVGVDIGCGMIAVRTSLDTGQLPDDLDGLIPRIEVAVPAGLGKWHQEPSDAALSWYASRRNERLSSEQEARCLVQFGTLGSGNHFFEVCADEHDGVWVVMHSGSRGVGNQLANQHIKVAKHLCKADLPDPELAWIQEGVPQFDAYIADMLWAQDYAMANRQQMMEAALRAIFGFIGTGSDKKWVNCHHNFSRKEHHDGRDVWVTRKGAIYAGIGALGVIPGSMGGKSYIVRGLGNPLSYESCSHGAGRTMGRREARRRFTPEDLTRAMKGRTWQADKASELLDEIPASYKDIDIVMKDQDDLVEIVHELRGLVNYKGTS